MAARAALRGGPPWPPGPQTPAGADPSPSLPFLAAKACSIVLQHVREGAQAADAVSPQRQLRQVCSAAEPAFLGSACSLSLCARPRPCMLKALQTARRTARIAGHRLLPLAEAAAGRAGFARSSTPRRARQAQPVAELSHSEESEAEDQADQLDLDYRSWAGLLPGAWCTGAGPADPQHAQGALAAPMACATGAAQRWAPPGTCSGAGSPLLTGRRMQRLGACTKAWRRSCCTRRPPETPCCSPSACRSSRRSPPSWAESGQAPGVAGVGQA